MVGLLTNPQADQFMWVCNEVTSIMFAPRREWDFWEENPCVMLDELQAVCHDSQNLPNVKPAYEGDRGPLGDFTLLPWCSLKWLTAMDVVRTLNLAESLGDANRTFKQNGFRINSNKCNNPRQRVTLDDVVKPRGCVDFSMIAVSRGKKDVKALVFIDRSDW